MRGTAVKAQRADNIREQHTFAWLLVAGEGSEVGSTFRDNVIMLHWK